MSAPASSLSHEELLSLLPDHQALIDLCNRRRVALATSPSQSDFRVFAFLIIKSPSSGLLSLIEGTNAEQGYIGGAICAERSALVKLRFLEEEPELVKVVVVTDSKHSVSPGMLCREYMMSVSRRPEETVVVMGNFSGTVITQVDR